MSDERTGDRQKFPVTVICPRCKRSGPAVWEEAEHPVAGVADHALVSLPEGFYHRVRKNRVLETEVVCAKCGSVVIH
jgi:hypothetical protein